MIKNNQDNNHLYKDGDISYEERFQDNDVYMQPRLVEARKYGNIQDVRKKLANGFVLWKGWPVTQDQYDQCLRMEEYWKRTVTEKYYRWIFKNSITCKLVLEDIKKNRAYETEKISVIELCYKVSIKNLIIESKKFEFDDWKDFHGQIPEIKKIFENKPNHALPYSLSNELIESLEDCNFLDDVIQHAGTKHSKMVGNLIINEFKNKEKLSDEIFDDVDKRRSFISNILKSDDVKVVVDVVEDKTDGELAEWCLESIKSHDRALIEFKSGKDSAINAFKGDIMKKSKGKYSPKLIDETLREQIKKL